MKNIIKQSTKLLIILYGIAILLVSCNYQEIKDADYPDQTIYMPAAYNGTYLINSVPAVIGSTPTPGYPYRFKVDTLNRKFIVPLSVYRAGIDNVGAFSVDVLDKSDTVVQMISLGKLTETELLTASKFSFPSSVSMEEGKELAPIELQINLDFLLANPNKKYALGIGIDCKQRKLNPLLKTTIVVIETKILVPTANFSSGVDPSNAKKITFSNSSLYSTVYKWNFGDGTSTSNDKSPIHIYATSGTYTVTLNAIGVTGTSNKSTKTAVVTVP